MEIAQPKNWVDRVAIWCAKWLILIILASAIAIWVRSSGNHFAFAMLIGFLLPVWFLVVIIQLLVRRKRPFEHGKKPLVRMLVGAPSFPSAHTAIAAAVTGVFSYYLFVGGVNDTAFFVATIVYGFLTVVIAWSRVRVGVHYVSDTVAGAIIGLGIPWATLLFLANAAANR